MKVQVDKELKNNNYSVSISILEEEVGNYLEAVHDFGESALNFGGQLLDTDDTTILAVIPNKSVKVTELVKTPMTQVFTTVQYGAIAEKIANQWADFCVKKIEAYVKEVSAKIDTFTGVQVIDI